MKCTNCGHLPAAHEEDSPQRLSCIADEIVAGCPCMLRNCLIYRVDAPAEVPVVQMQQNISGKRLRYRQTQMH